MYRRALIGSRGVAMRANIGDDDRMEDGTDILRGFGES